MKIAKLFFPGIYEDAYNGFYQIDMIWDERGPVTLEKPMKRLDARCLNTSARF